VDQARVERRGLLAFWPRFVQASFPAYRERPPSPMPVIRKKRTWLESHDYRRHRRRREFWLVLAGAMAFAAVVTWLLWAMS